MPCYSGATENLNAHDASFYIKIGAVCIHKKRENQTHGRVGIAIQSKCPNLIPHDKEMVIESNTL